MAKSKANKAKKNKASSKPKKSVDAVEAKLAEKEKLALEADEGVETDDEEVVDDEEIVEDEDVEEEDSEDEDEDDEEDEDEDEDDDDSDDDDDEDDDDDDDSDDEDDDDEEEEDEDEDDDDSDDDDDEDDDDKTVTRIKAKEDKKSKHADKKAAAKMDKKAAKKAAKIAAIKAKKEAKEIVKDKKVIASNQKPGAFKTFFKRKCDPTENILTIFKDSKIIGAILGELIGTMLITTVALTLGLFNPLYLIFAYVGITIVVFKLSGANLNPLVTAGMLATRRMSAIRGVLYFIAQVIGAWAGYMIINGFLSAGIATGNIDSASISLPILTAAEDITVVTEGSSYFWPITLLEFFGSAVIGFAFCRATSYKRSPFTFAATVSAGVFLAMLLAVVISSTYLGINDSTFMLNPAVALVYGVLPSAAEGFDALMQAMLPMLVTYVLFPVIGGIVGFFISDIAGQCSGEDLAAE